jgi:hypothetical protein
MGCRYAWADDNQFIMNLSIQAPWSWDEYNDLMAEVFPILKATGKPCATAVDVSKIGKLPNGNALSYLRRAEKLIPENVFASAIIGAPYIVTVFLDVLAHTYPHVRRITMFATTLSEAHQKLHDKYQEITAS